LSKKSPTKKIVNRKKTGASEADLDLKELLKKEALIVMQKSGPHGFSLRELARRLKVSHGAPYRHYLTKEDLLAAVVEDGFNELSSRMSQVRKEEPDLRQQFLKMGQAYVNFVKQHPDHARLMFGGFVANPIAHPECKQAGDSAFKTLLELVMQMQEAHIFKKSNPLELAYVIWSAVHGFAMLHIDRQFELLETELNEIKELGLEFSPESAVNLIGQVFLLGMKG
jgi:AcrR family transcriptional regulator